MRKAERLFRIVELLRGRRTAVTAQSLAETLEVSLRTVYRDIAALQLSGVPVEGEAGVGYRLSSAFHLPPVMFDRDEVQALLVGARLTQAFTDPDLGRAARSAEVKIRAILDESAKARAERQPYRAPIMAGDDVARRRHGVIRKATEAKAKLALSYRDESDRASRRVVWPLGLICWTRGVWTLCAWCELRDDYRNFRFDRIEQIETLPERYEERRDRSLAHYLAQFDDDPELN